MNPETKNLLWRLSNVAVFGKPGVSQAARDAIQEIERLTALNETQAARIAELEAALKERAQ